MRRGQVALEFLTTYGWAFLIILVMIGAISYFGVMNPSKVLPSKCVVGAEMTCKDYRIGQDGVVNVILEQSAGKTIYVQSVVCSRDGTDVTDTTVTVGDAWSPKDQLQVTCDFGNAFEQLSGEKTKLTFEIVYKKSTAGFDHLVEGEVYSDVQ